MVQIKISPNGSSITDWHIVELQGDLETKTKGTSLNGELVGDLHFTKQDIPVLIIGHHILYGKVVNLDKPLMVIHKDEHDGDGLADGVARTSEGKAANQMTSYSIDAVIRKKLLFKTRPKPIIANVPKKFSQKQLDEKTGRFGVGRFSYLRDLVTEFQDSDSEEAKLQVLANLANFSYDPINYPHLMQLNVLGLFLDCLQNYSQDSSFVQYAIGGICNACLGNENKDYILKKKGVELVTNCLTSSNEETVVTAMTLLMFLVTPESKPDIVSPPIIDAMVQFSQSRNPRVKNLAAIFLTDYCNENQVKEAQKMMQQME